MLLRAPMPNVSRDDAPLALAPVPTAAGGGQNGGARLRVPRHLAILRRAAHAQRVDAVGVAVAELRIIIFFLVYV